MIQNPKMVFEIGYFSQGAKSNHQRVMFRISHQDQRSRDGEASLFSSFAAANGIVVHYNTGPRLFGMSDVGIMGSMHEYGGFVTDVFEAPTGEKLCLKIIEALSEWAGPLNPIWHGDVYVDDPEEPRGPVIIEEGQTYKFILP